MRAVVALAFALLAAAPVCRAQPARTPAVDARELDRQVKDDYNAVRRARYALRKAQAGTPEEARARQAVDAAKQKLKEDRLKLRDLKLKLAEKSER